MIAVAGEMCIVMVEWKLNVQSELRGFIAVLYTCL